jgi:hypothetical protein
MDLFAIGVEYPVSTVVGTASFLVSPLVLAYRWKRTPSARRLLDGFQRRFTGRPDWSWLRLWHVLLGLAIVTAANIAFQVATLHCSDDSLAILASGQAALRGQNPFLVNYCNGTSPAQIPYGTAEVALNAIGALSGTVAGMWLVWQLLALAVIPLVWHLAGEDRRYVTALVATSVLYLPNIATNIGVENAVVPVAVLLMLYSLTRHGRRRPAVQVLSAFLATARFPSLFGLLGTSASLPRWRAVAQWALVLATFLGAVFVSYALWGWSAISVVYLGQFSRASNESLNFLAVFLVQGWLHSSLESAVIQGAGLLALVLFVHWRGYEATAACSIPLIGVMALSQYLTFHFVLWLVPLLLLGGRVNRWLYVYGALAWFDENIPLGVLGLSRGIWWPYEVCGVALTALLVYVAIVIVRAEEIRRTGAAAAPADPSRAPALPAGV